MTTRKDSLRKFYKSTVSFIVLSDRPIEGMEFDQLLYQTDEGDMVMGATTLTTVERTRAEINADLEEAGSDAEFFPQDEDD